MLDPVCLLRCKWWLLFRPTYPTKLDFVVVVVVTKGCVEKEQRTSPSRLEIQKSHCISIRSSHLFVINYINLYFVQPLFNDLETVMIEMLLRNINNNKMYPSL